MKLNEQWLREWAAPPISRQALVEQLTMVGLEVESVEPVAGSFHGVVIGEIVTLSPHPRADRLQVCEVKVGDAAPVVIVTGATNVYVGLKVPVAKPGAELANGQQIASTTLRGVASHGMLCSAVELGLAEVSQGIWQLPETAPVGQDIRQWLTLDDYTIQMKLTPNRGDCLSVLGIAREVAVANHFSIKLPEISAVSATISDTLLVKVAASADCPRYVGRVIRHVNAHAVTPMWLQERLRRCGLRSINIVVDVMNYVMLELGQPLHAFDLAKLSNSVHVRRAKPDETITLLDGQIKALNADTLVIADDEQAHAIAGIMGGMDSAVTEATQDIFLESAFFNPLVISGRARAYNLSTDASHRFERGVDPVGQARACERATQLLLDMAGGQPGPLIEVSDTAYLPQPTSITLRHDRITRVLGIAVPDSLVVEVLQRLNMDVASDEGGWRVIPPTYRFDIAIEVDLIEEIARIYGYHQIPEHYPQYPARFLPRSEAIVTVSKLRQVLVGRGYREAITYSFVDPRLQQLVDPKHPALSLVNPISSEMAVMRTSLWPGLLSAVLYNLNRQQTRVRLFETGLQYVQGADGLLQQKMFSGVAIGNVHTEQWGLTKRAMDFFDVKADVEALLSCTHRLTEFVFLSGSHPALHPGKTCQVVRHGQCIGYFGAIHPALEEALELSETAYLFEFMLDELVMGKIPHFSVFSKFPSIRRDIAFVVDRVTPVNDILHAVRDTVGELLQEMILFDVYQGANVDSDKKSLAFGLVLQHPTRTLVDSEVNEIMDRVVLTLKQTFSVMIRDMQYGADKD